MVRFTKYLRYISVISLLLCSTQALCSLVQQAIEHELFGTPIEEEKMRNHTYHAVLVKEEAQAARHARINLQLINKQVAPRLQLPKVLQERILQYATPIEQYYEQLLPALGFPIIEVLKQSTDLSFFDQSIKQLYYDYYHSTKSWDPYTSNFNRTLKINHQIAVLVAETDMLGMHIQDHTLEIINSETIVINPKCKQLQKAFAELQNNLSQEQFYFIINFAQIYKNSVTKVFALNKYQSKLFNSLPQAIQDNLQKSYNVHLTKNPDNICRFNRHKTWWQSLKEYAQSTLTFFNRHKKAAIITVAAAITTYMYYKKPDVFRNLLHTITTRLKQVFSLI